MIGHYLYALCAARQGDMAVRLGNMTGLGGQISLRQIGSQLLIHSTEQVGEIDQTRRNMLAHTRVLEAADGPFPLLPMRFGLVCEDLKRVDRLVLVRMDDIVAHQSRLGGAREYGIRVSVPRDRALAGVAARNPSLVPGKGNGARYIDRVNLGQRIAETLDRDRGSAQAAMLALLRPIVRDLVLRAPDEDTEILRAEVLVADDRIDDVVRQIAEVARRDPFTNGGEPSVRVIGPAPAYNFISLSLERELAAEQA